MNWIHITEYIGLFGLWCNLVIIGLNTARIFFAYYNPLLIPNTPYSWTTALQIFCGHIIGIFGRSHS